MLVRRTVTCGDRDGSGTVTSSHIVMSVLIFLISYKSHVNLGTLLLVWVFHMAFAGLCSFECNSFLRLRRMAFFSIGRFALAKYTATKYFALSCHTGLVNCIMLFTVFKKTNINFNCNIVLNLPEFIVSNLSPTTF